jgi:8-amino-7-oxononanoate synthase
VTDPLDFIDAELARDRAAGLTRRLLTVTSRQGRSVEVGDRRLLSFCSNDYLGLAGDERLARAAVAAIARYGVGAAASRLVSGTMTLHADLEARLTRFAATEAALCFPTGYAANLGAIAALVGKGDLIASDRLNHASIIDGCRLSGATLRVYPHGDVDALDGILRRGAAFRRRLVVTDTVFSMDGDVAPLRDIADAAERRGAILMIDEAHATGLLGEHGRGAAEALGVSDRVDVKMGTLSKALGVLGGYVAGSPRLIEFLRQRARSFIYSTAPPPALCAAAIAALDIVEAEPERRRHCLELAARLASAVGGQRPAVRVEEVAHPPLGVPSGAAGGPPQADATTPDTGSPGRVLVRGASCPTAIIPMLVGSADLACRLADGLVERGFLVRAIRPPTVPAGTSRLRLTVSAAHTAGDVDALCAALRDCGFAQP